MSEHILSLSYGKDSMACFGACDVLGWPIKTGRTVIYQVKGERAYKLPDHHNSFGEAWWIDGDVPIENISCVFSADKDA